MIYKLSQTPPSLNMSSKNRSGKGKGRYSTPEYTAWQKLSGYELLPIKPIKTDKYALYIQIPRKTRGDIDNRIKAVSDLLVKHGATPDDCHMDFCQIERADIDYTRVEVVEIGD